MSLRFAKDETTGIYRVTGEPGLVLTLEMIQDVDRRLVEFAGDLAGMRVLYDMRGIDTTQLSSSDFERLVADNAELWKAAVGGRAVVLSEQPVAFGQARQYELLSEQRRVRAFMAFRDHDAAVAWLLEGGPAAR